MTQAKNVALGVSNFNSAGQLSLTTGVTGTLPVANGGTGSATGYFASGTALLFYQVSAPTGWTKSTSNDNKALRVVSGATGGSSGGSVAFTTAFASQAVAGTVGTSGSTTAVNNSYTPAGSVGTSGSTTITTSTMPSHNHSASDSGHTHVAGPSNYYILDGNLGQYTPGGSSGGGIAMSSFSTNTGFASISIGNNGSGGSHNHTGGTFSGTPATITQTSHTHTGGTFTGTAIDLAVQYIDVIVATKD